MVAFSVGACSILEPSPSSPSTPNPVARRPAFGDADRALRQLDVSALTEPLDGGKACRRDDGGGSSSDDTFHREWIVTCPRLGDDRNIYFLIVDAIDAELRKVATTPGHASQLGDAQDPLSTLWDVRGNAYVGSMRALGVNGNGNLSVFVSLDLAVP
jgi:hypothetical protein